MIVAESYINWTDWSITLETSDGDWAFDVFGSNNRIIRVYQNGVQLGSNETFNVDMNNFDGPTLLPLIIGSMDNGGEPFQGYITNFRWNKGTCYYNTGTFTVPTSPLPVDGAQLLLLASNETDLIVDK